MSGLVLVRYINLPTSLWQKVISSRELPTLNIFFIFLTIGVEHGFPARTPTSDTCLEHIFVVKHVYRPWLATSNLIKKFKSSRSFTLKVLSSSWVTSFISEMELPWRIISFTYTNNAVKLFSFLFINSEWSKLDCKKPMLLKKEESLANHCLLAYLRSYKDFVSLQTCPTLTLIPGSGSI